MGSDEAIMISVGRHQTCTGVQGQPQAWRTHGTPSNYSIKARFQIRGGDKSSSPKSNERKVEASKWHLSVDVDER